MKKKLVSMLLVTCMTAAMLGGCGNTIEAPETPETTTPGGTVSDGGEGGEGTVEAADPLAFAAGTELRMATGYNSASTGIVLIPRPSQKPTR